MDEKTEALRDIFIDVTDESGVTEQQEDARGSLARDGSPAERTGEIIDEMADRYDFETDLETGTLVELVRGFYGEDSDADLAAALDESNETIVRARMDLHLVRDADREGFDFDGFRDRLDAGTDIDTLAAEFDVSESTARRRRRVVETEAERRAVGDRFREAFDEIYLDADLASHTDEVARDGLDEATEGMENDLSF